MAFYHGNQAAFLASRPCCPTNPSIDRFSTVARVADHTFLITTLLVRLQLAVLAARLLFQDEFNRGNCIDNVNSHAQIE